MGNLRRSRGYSFEHGLVERFKSAPGWDARRLGGSSTGLPDIVAVNNPTGTLLAIEAKAGTADELYVPFDQTERCYVVCNMFGFYAKRRVILAFKFMSKKRFRRKGVTVYENRALVEYFFDITPYRNNLEYKCTYDGKLFWRNPDEKQYRLVPDLTLESQSDAFVRRFIPPFNN